MKKVVIILWCVLVISGCSTVPSNKAYTNPQNLNAHLIVNKNQETFENTQVNSAASLGYGYGGAIGGLLMGLTDGVINRAGSDERTMLNEKIQKDIDQVIYQAIAEQSSDIKWIHVDSVDLVDTADEQDQRQLIDSFDKTKANVLIYPSYYFDELYTSMTMKLDINIFEVMPESEAKLVNSDYRRILTYTAELPNKSKNLVAITRKKANINKWLIDNAAFAKEKIDEGIMSLIQQFLLLGENKSNMSTVSN